MQHGRVIDTWMVEGEGGRNGRGKRAEHAGPRIFRGMSIPASCPPSISIPAAALSSNSSSNSVRPPECTRSPDGGSKISFIPVTWNWKLSPRALDSIFSYLLSLSLSRSLSINNKIVLTTRDSFLSSLRAEGLVGLVDSRDWFERIRVPVSYVYIHRVQWCCPMGDGEGEEEEEEKEGIEKKKKLWFESVEILISVVDETRDRGKRVTREGRGDAGFPPPSFPPPQRHRPSPCLGYKVVACLQAQSLCRWSTDPRKHLARPKNRPTTRVNDATPICISVYRTTATPSKQVYFFFIFFLYRRSFEFRFSIRR